MMGGSIGVTSTPGAGSKFRFTARFEIQTRASGGGEPICPDLAGTAALIVTDNSFTFEILKDQLSARNALVRQARNGTAALCVLRAAVPNGAGLGVLIIDDLLPDMPGAELARAVTSEAAAVEPRIILLASFAQNGAQLGNGAVRYLTKPIRQSGLWDCLGADRNAVGPELLAAVTCLSSEKAGSGARVLLVEDSPVNMEVGVAILQSMGCTVETAENGVRALDRHANTEYHLIFMDCQMPVMDGFDATIEIRRRENAAARHTPIVALTASVVEDGRQRCLAVGMDDYLAKPFTLEQMKAMLTIWLGRSADLAGTDGPFHAPSSPPARRSN